MKNKESYNKEIKEYFSIVKSRVLSDLTSSSIKSRCIYLLNKDLKDSDKRIIVNFLKIGHNEDLKDAIIKLKVDTFKSIRNYLDFNHKTKSLRNEETYNFVAWIIGFNPRPFPEYLKDNNENLNGTEVETKLIDQIDENIPLLENTQKDNQEKDTKSQENTIAVNVSQESSKSHNLIALIIFALCAILFLVIYLQSNSAQININNINNNSFKQITPTKNTKFFSKETGEPQVWYTIYNDNYEFFNAEGYHPISNEALKPINREIVRTLFIEKLPVEEKKNLDNKNFYQNKTSKHKYGIYNNNILDLEINTLLNKNTDLYNYNGTIKYTFRENTISKKLIVCEISLIYNIFSKKSEKKIDSKIIKTDGSGFSKQEAKQNAISNIEL